MRSPSLATLLSLTLASAPLAAQGAPAFDDVSIGDAPLDAGGTVPVLMDVHLPPGASAPVPVVLFIHGGGWQSGDQNQLSQGAQALLARGLAVATIDYRLSSQAVFPAQIHDVKGAVRWLRANAATLGVDPARVGCWGTSAGAHLAALLATSSGVAACEGTTGGNLAFSSAVSACVDFFGPTELVQMSVDVTTPPGAAFDHDAPSSPESKLLGFDGAGEGLGVLRANLANPVAPFPALAALAALSNPITHVDPSDPDFLVSHGTSDTTVPFHQSERLVSALGAASVTCVWRPVPNAGHGNLGAATDAAAAAFLVLELSDCDQNGMLDAADVAAGNAFDSDGDGLLDGCEVTNPAPFCAGDGALADHTTPCPCGNNGAPGNGCGHSFLASGANLSATGQVALDTVVLRSQFEPATSFTLMMQHANAGDSVFHDGVLCAANPLIRLRGRAAVGGAASFPSSAFAQDSTTTLSQRGGVTIGSGATRYYAAWYRNASTTFCPPATANVTNGVRVVW